MTNIYKKRLMSATALSALALGVLAFNPEVTQAVEGTVQRIQGNDRYETATLISNQAFESSDTVIIANAMGFADALSGVPLAYEKEAPILLAHGTKLKTATITEIKRLGAKEAIILGGDAAISQSIEKELEALGLSVQRLSGDNRYETSAIIADELAKTSPSDKAVVVDGMEFADAMSIAPFAAQEGMPIYLTKTNSLSNAGELKDYSETYIVGGENAVSKIVEEALNSVTRLAGMDRYETNREVIDHFGVEANGLYVSTGLNFADALTGSVLAARNNSAVAFVKGDIHSQLLAQFENNSFNAFTILGGEAAVSNRVQDTLVTYIASKTVIKEEMVTENVVDYITIEQENNQLPEGDTSIIQEGKDGYNEVTYEVIYVNGKETHRTEVKRITVDSIKEIKEFGSQITEIVEEVVTKNIVNHEILEQENNQLPEGETRIIQEGKDGYDELTYTVTLVNGEETKRVEINRKTVDSIEEIIKIGSQVTEIMEEESQENHVEIKVKEIEDDTIPVGEKFLKQKGETGYDLVVFEVTYINGNESKRKEISREVFRSVEEVVQVGTKVEVTSVDITNNPTELFLGENFTINTQITPENATVQDVKWSSSDLNVVTVDGNGVLNALNEGSATITVESVDGGKIDSISITVDPVSMKSLKITNETVSLYEMETLSLDTEILPNNTTHKSLTWYSNNEKIAKVNQKGEIIAVKAGTVDITVVNESKSLSHTVNVEVIKPDVVSHEELNYTITQFDAAFGLPGHLNHVKLSSGFETEAVVNWEDTTVNINKVGTFTFEGNLEYYDYPVQLTLNVEKFVPNVSTHAYSMFTINGVSQTLSINLTNFEGQSLEINRIELYENGVLYTTLTAAELIDSDINTTVQFEEQWGISINFGTGFLLKNSFVRYYGEMYGEEYTFDEFLD